MDINIATNAYSTASLSQNQTPYEVQASNTVKGKGQDDITHNLEGKKDSSKSSKEDEIIAAIEKANKKFDTSNTEFSFSVHEATKQIMIKVIDKETKKVIKEFPPEKILDMVAHSMELAGLIVDEKF
jgi:flagellar protein FlaG